MSDEREIVQKLRDDAAGMISAATEQRQYYAVLGVYAMTCLEAADEIERLRSLITAWADACILMERTGSLDTTTPEGVAAGQALIELRKAVGR